MDELSEPPTDINPYQVLEIETNATSNDVKTAYRKLALQYHPGMIKQGGDKNPPLTSSQTKLLPMPKTPPTPSSKK